MSEQNKSKNITGHLGKAFKDAYRWLSLPPKHQFTLGDLVTWSSPRTGQRRITQPLSDPFSLNLCRGGRIVERIGTLVPAFLLAAAAVGSANPAPLLILAMQAKAIGLAAGGVTDIAIGKSFRSPKLEN